MGAVESKKDGVIKKYQLVIDLQAKIKSQLLSLTNWSFPDIKQTYDSYCRMGDCPFIDFFTFHKIMPFPTEVSRHLFSAYAPGQQYVNIFEIICLLILTSHNSYRKKLQLMFVMFDFTHSDLLTNQELMLIFQSTVNAFCRATDQPRPKSHYLAKYTIERFIRVNTLEALQKVVSYRRLIEEVEGNTDCFQLYKRFNQEIYAYFNQQSYLFKRSQYKKYEPLELEKMYRILKRVNLDNNYEQVELVDKNRRFRLENRKVQCVKQLLEEKQEKFKTIYPSRNRMNSMVASSSQLPSLLSKRKSFTKGQAISKRQSLSKMSPFMSAQQSPVKKQKGTASSMKGKQVNKVLFLNGRIQDKQHIFETIKYFKSLTGLKTAIKPKQFFNSFEKKNFIKKQVQSMFKYLDLNKKGEVSFEDFLKVYYRNITEEEIKTIKQWVRDYKKIHEADHFGLEDEASKKEKKNHVELPRTTLRRIDEIFNSIDQQRKGYLTLQDLKKAYSTGFTIKELQQMMKEFGDNNKMFKQRFTEMILPEEWTIEGTSFVGA